MTALALEIMTRLQFDIQGTVVAELNQNDMSPERRKLC